MITSTWVVQERILALTEKQKFTRQMGCRAFQMEGSLGMAEAWRLQQESTAWIGFLFVTQASA